MAHAYLAATMGNLSMYEQVTPEEAWRVGSAASQKALQLDPLEPSAYLNLAADKVFYEYDFPAAQSLLMTAKNHCVAIVPLAAQNTTPSGLHPFAVISL